VTVVADRFNVSTERSYLFGPFQLLPAAGLLRKGNEIVRIGGRALAILTALVERAGDVVSKDELMAIAWPQTVVGDGNLKVAVAALRRVLGEDHPGERYLTNEPRRGYRFIAPVLLTGGGGVAGRRHGRSEHNLPYFSTRLIGRADVVESLVKILPERRLVSIVGPAGIGKTSVALAVAESMAGQCEHGVRFIDLTSLRDVQAVAVAMAETLGVKLSTECAIHGAIMMLRERRVVLVFDGCENLLPTTAAMIGHILSAAPGVLVLTTTREPLRIRDETIHRLAPLAVPPTTAGLTVSQARGFSALELFIERASARLEGFGVADDDVPLLADICRKLDGTALAIELAATRVDTFTLRELSALLDDQSLLLSLNQNSPVARHRSLAAAFDWSHALLTENERTVLRRVSVFTAAFTLASAHAVVGDDCDVIAAIEGLVAKSLLSADVAGPLVEYRLLRAVRAYAAQRLLESGECDDVCRRHEKSG